MPISMDVVIVGAGPYGLSLAAHLRALKVDYLIVGEPMRSWANMPKGMLLKSDGFATSLSEPRRQFTLSQFCKECSIRYEAIGVPVSAETFSSYGLAFQRALVPELLETSVAEVDRVPSGFLVKLENDRLISCRAVVVAAGLSHYDFIPSQLSGLPRELLSHSTVPINADAFGDGEIVIIGGGSSAIDIAALLHENKKRVRLITRRKALEFHSKMRLPRPLWDRIRHPLSPIGPGWKSRAYSDVPDVFHHLPVDQRVKVVNTHLGPAGGWFMKERMREVPVLTEVNVQSAELVAAGVRLSLTGQKPQTVIAERVIAATGFKVDFRRLSFLSGQIRASLRAEGTAPALSRHFETSIPGLYFIGAASAYSFGPVMRFVAGTKFTVERLSRRLVDQI